MATDTPEPGNVAFDTRNADLQDAPYTQSLLAHAPPQHLHQTTARLFIGPLPEGWVKTHKQTWFGIKKTYTGKEIKFRAQPGTLTRRRLTGIDRSPRPEPDTSTSTSGPTTSQSVSTYTALPQPQTHTSALDYSATTPSSTSHPSNDPQAETSLDRLVRTSDVMKALSRSDQRKKEDELRRLEEDREDRVREENEVMDLQPVPTEDEPAQVEADLH